jgi:hypothetical protein
MSNTLRRGQAGTRSGIEGLHPWIAAVLCALLHLLVLLLLLLSPPVTLSTPQGSAPGSRVVEVNYIDDPRGALQVTDVPPSPPEPAPAEPPKPAASRLQATPVERAQDPLPPEATDTPDARSPSPRRRASPKLPVPSRPEQARPPSPPQASARPGHVWGQPPGMLQENLAPVHAGPARSPAVEQGRRYDTSASAEPRLEVGGYRVLYEPRGEPRLRAWRDQGMTEVFVPLPGVRQLMVCPLETVIRHESGPCRLVEPDDPALSLIGDAREVITMHQVYRRGELVWRGPGPYR